ncbi:tRNA (adenosine(37)-N6)-threonylcarbamoyltransferase complex transferase subunit TsaD [Thermospira aquatica]|uniref:tRNA N6-adenosine threonylcarbamoyltransferase n=1 Tax=Thermospira aquatica TaxID=2828656 RepID=A0AAX3BFM7_9SPIR|nr:tRNA (adenosine(37)-N6)-threonylcarbamoyltransferase complex transferase subunit TsaD [Thermospira aquatica]URA11100.1 tRNA (adenosine(37)-N6)-threonylcarbamoyltransferase complex transferase subunit TsaD [Thermospira aquatica]
MRILGIETSCDETSVALVENGRTILKERTHSQVMVHKEFDGVVPEIASRQHLVYILSVLEEVISPGQMTEVDAIAVTQGPGLIGSLLVGLGVAKALAYSFQKPLVPVNHIEAHLYAPHLFADIAFPYVGLVASGGHTLLFLVRGFHDYEVLGSTIDDAVGEAFDKLAKVLHLGYPGGPIIDKLAQQGDPDAFLEFGKRPQLLPDTERDRYNFSYSGLKTAFTYRIQHLDNVESKLPNICAAFQREAIDLLLRKSWNALEDHGISRFVISGGVSANSYLRKQVQAWQKKGIETFMAPLEYCGDNAAMVAGRAYHDALKGKYGDLRTDAYSRLGFVRKGKRKV